MFKLEADGMRNFKFTENNMKVKRGATNGEHCVVE